MTDHDEMIGRNLARLRQGMSQTELANEMRALGHKWTQPTVVTIEKGDRPLRMSEALDAAGLLGVDLQDLVKYPVALDFFHQQLRTEEASAQLLAWARRYEAQVRLLVEAAQAYASETGASLDDELELVSVVDDEPAWQIPSARRQLDRYADEMAAYPERRSAAGVEPERIPVDGERQAEG